MKKQSLNEKIIYTERDLVFAKGIKKWLLKRKLERLKKEFEEELIG